MVSKSGARDIILSQIKQDFVTPANAIFDYLDIVEKALSKLDVPSDDELDQIKSSCTKLINQYDEAFNLYTNQNSSKFISKTLKMYEKIDDSCKLCV